MTPSGSVPAPSGGTSTSAPRHWAITPPPASSGRDHDGHSSRNDHHHRRLWGWPYTYGYGVDYGGRQNEQDRLAEDARLEQDRRDDRLRQRELERQLADQRAADAAGASVRSPYPTTSDEEISPTLLIYKDHRQTEIRTYAITRNMIYEFGSKRARKIALSDLDIPATIAANKELGIEFNLPRQAPAKVRQP